MHNFSQAGVYSVNVSYLGDSNYRSGFVSILQLVMDGSRTDTNITLTPPPDPVYVDQVVSFTVEVTPDPPNVGTVIGEVSLIIARNGSIITVRNAYLEEGIAYINYTFTEAGTYNVSAVY